MFDKPGQKHLAVIWQVLIDWHLKYPSKDELPLPILVTQAYENIMQDPGLASNQTIHAGLSSFIENYDMLSEEDLKRSDTQTYVLDECQKLIDEFTVTEAISDFDVENVAGSLTGLQDVVRQTRIATRQPEDLDPISEPKLKHPTGFEPFDKATGGGFGPGDTCGVVAATSGGKTVLAVQLSLMFMEQGKRVLFLCYENKFHPEYWRRMVASVCGFSTERIMQVTDKRDFTPEEMEKYETIWLTKYAPLITVLDLRDDTSGMLTIESILDDHQASGQHDDLVVVDQWFQVIQNYANASGGKINTTMASITLTSQVTRVAEDYCTALLLLNQRKPGLSFKPKRKPESGDAAYDSGFPMWLTGCVGLGVQDDNHIAWVAPMKQRHCTKDAYSKIKITYLGMTDVSNRYRDDTEGDNFVELVDFAVGGSHTSSKGEMDMRGALPTAQPTNL